MKIVHVITAFGIGGAEKLLLNIINKQIEKHEVHLIYLKPINDLVQYLDNRVQVSQIPFGLSITLKLKDYFSKTQPDIIHSHLGHADLASMWAVKSLNVKLFCTMHNIYFKQNFIDLFFFKAYRFLFKKLSPNIKVISISKSVEIHVINVLGLPKEQSYLLYNAIPQIHFEKPKQLNVTSHNVNLLFVGRLVKQKSIHTLLNAIKLLKQKNISLTIVGEGVLEKELKEYAIKNGIEDKVVFVGKQLNPYPYYKKADIFVLPSIWEGFGIVILEAFRAKTAVIASNIEGPSELITHKKNGLLFPVKNDCELAKNIELLIDNIELRNSIAKEGYKSFKEKFHIDTYVQNLEKLYTNA